MTRTHPIHDKLRVFCRLGGALAFVLAGLLAVCPASAQDRADAAAAGDQAEATEQAQAEQAQPEQPGDDAAADQDVADADAAGEGFEKAAGGIQKRLEDAQAELAALREQITNETLPLSRELSKLEGELKEARREYQKVSNTNAARALEKGNLEREIKTRKESAVYLSNFMDDYVRKLEAGLHVAEVDRYSEVIDQAKLALENRALADTPEERYGPQLDALEMSLTRLEEALGGASFNGTAVDPAGKVHNGRFLLFGPIAVFGSADGGVYGLIDKAPGSNRPAIVPYNDPLHAQAAAKVVQEGGGELPIDTTLGNARIIEQTEESFIEQVKAGGPVMIPIGLLAALAILLGVIKLIALLFVRKPGRARLSRLLQAVAKQDKVQAIEAAKKVPGPSGKMLQAGVEHLGEPRELIEEVMYEHVLATKLKTQRLLPFIAICAAAAPLLGLLGTVSGIINTFNMMKIFDSADMKNVSGGISEALITTQYGLIVAIPALLFHAVLSRMAKSVVDNMEKSGVAFINQVMKNKPGGDGETSGLVKPQGDPDPIVPDDQSGDEREGESLSEGGGDQAAEADGDRSPAEHEREPEPVLAQSGVGVDGGDTSERG